MAKSTENETDTYDPPGVEAPEGAVGSGSTYVEDQPAPEGATPSPTNVLTGPGGAIIGHEATAGVTVIGGDSPEHYDASAPEVPTAGQPAERVELNPGVTIAAADITSEVESSSTDATEEATSE
jgi:hypothetical protein